MRRTHYTDSQNKKNDFGIRTKAKKGTNPNINVKTFRVLTPLVAGTDNYKFDLKEKSNNGQVPHLEQLMDPTRCYQVYDARVSIVKVLPTAIPGTPGPALDPRQFVDPSVFTDPDEQISLRKVYAGGHLAFKISNDTIIEEFDTHFFEDSLSGAQIGSLLEDKGYIEFDPNMVFDGDEAVKLELQLGHGTSTKIEGVDPVLKNFVMIELYALEHLGTLTKAGTAACPALNFAAS